MVDSQPLRNGAYEQLIGDTMGTAGRHRMIDPAAGSDPSVSGRVSLAVPFPATVGSNNDLVEQALKDGSSYVIAAAHRISPSPHGLADPRACGLGCQRRKRWSYQA
jgi:hypothetical protein